jgi:hypothetical protein
MLGPDTLTMSTSMEVMTVPTNSTSKVSAGCAGTAGGDGLIAAAFEEKSAGAVSSREQAWRRPSGLRGWLGTQVAYGPAVRATPATAGFVRRL